MKSENIEDWIADIGMRCNGKFFAKDWPENDTVPVTVADMQKLMNLNWEEVK